MVLSHQAIIPNLHTCIHIHIHRERGADAEVNADMKSSLSVQLHCSLCTHSMHTHTRALTYEHPSMSSNKETKNYLPISDRCLRYVISPLLW